MIGWLRRLLCRCPEPEPTIQNTGWTGGVYFDWQPTGGIDLTRVEQYQAEGSVAPWPAPPPPERHLRLVEPDDADE